MGYKKVYYDEIWSITSNGSNACKQWAEKLESVNKGITQLTSSQAFTGKSADNIKNYFNQVHSVLISVLGSICETYITQAASYYKGYQRSVDSGDGSNYGVRYTTIVFDEVDANGSISRKIRSIQSDAAAVANSAISVKNQISGLVGYMSSPNVDDLINQLNKAISKATTVNNRVSSYEGSRTNDFAVIDSLISHAQRIISTQLGSNRVPVASYQSGGIVQFCDLQDLITDINAASKIVEDFKASEDYEDAMNLAFNRDAIIHEEEKESREWVQWIAVGFAVAGAIVLTVATVGGASPLICVTIGAASGFATAASKDFADNYVENGSITEGMDWSKFGKDCLIGTATGAISGYAGSVSVGSSIQQPIDKALFNVAKATVENAAEGLIECSWDVGEAFISGKSGGEVISVLEKDVSDMIRDITVDGATDFVGGYISGSFDVNSAEKGYFKKLGEKTLENIGTSTTEFGLNTVWDVGEAVIDPNSSKDFVGILEANAKEYAGDLAKGEVEAVFEGFDSKLDKIDNSTRKVVVKTLTDTLSGTISDVMKGISSQSVEMAFGTRDSISIEEVWEDNLEDGRAIFKYAGNSAGKNIADEVNEEKSFYIKMKQKDYDKNGKLDVVVFDKYAVLKEDYDAAVANAGKGAYKDQSVQDILGLPRNTAVSEKHIRIETVDIEKLEKSNYKGRKTTNATKVTIKKPQNK